MPDFFDQPILNSPYSEPTRHWDMSPDGQPTQKINESRRPSSYLSPIPRPKNQSGSDAQQLLDMGDVTYQGDREKYNVSLMINTIRTHVGRWRAAPQDSWKVTPETARLLSYWRSHKFSDIRPFFCQVEAVETLIWLTEVAPNTAAGKRILDIINQSSEYANPGLLRFALKMATGAGKTTVMAMIIAWQTINAIRHSNSNLFTKGFLVVTPGLTVRDRLRVLQPNDPDSYYQKRELVPPDMLSEVKQARIVITNYHAFILREKLNLSTGTKNLLLGRTDDQPLQTTETEGQALQRIMPELLGMKRVMVLNDEAHHCYGQKPDILDGDEETPAKNKDEDESEKNNEAARVWISGLRSVAQRLDLIRVVDLSATPFFLQGSGYAEGTLFPWTVSDFSLMDAIECGIVKLPRVPVAENIASSDMPQYRNIWATIRKDMPKISRAKAGDLDPGSLPTKLLTALQVLYYHYVQTTNLWEQARSPVLPCFIIVCQNTAISELVYKYVSGYFLPPDENNNRPFKNGAFELFRNFREDGTPLSKPNTILVDSQQLDSGVAISKEFKAAAQEEIERFKREIVERTGDVNRAQSISDEDILREVMNTVGKPGTLGASVRCVVSVSMLTEGWDANTVTHICGIRAFGTQLLCEQVIGRALRRQSYETNDQGLFNVEYADIFGIPFDFAGKPTIAPPQPPADTVTVKALPERANCEIQFPRVDGYRNQLLPSIDISAEFSEDSYLELTPEMTGPTKTQNAGIIGQEIELTLKEIESVRPTSIEFHLTKHLLERYLRDQGKEVPINLYGSVKNIVHQWFENYLVCKGGTLPGMLVYPELAALACERIVRAISRACNDPLSKLVAILSPYNPVGTTTGVHFITSKKHRWKTNPNKCHLNYAICDSNWEIQFCQQLERDDRVLAYVRNHGIGFEVPYEYGGERKIYLPDFIVLMDDGHGKDDPLHVVVEIKGLQEDDDKAKRDTMLTYWVPGVNNLGSFGRWDFKQVNELWSIYDDSIINT